MPPRVYVNLECELVVAGSLSSDERSLSLATPLTMNYVSSLDIPMERIPRVYIPHNITYPNSYQRNIL